MNHLVFYIGLLVFTMCVVNLVDGYRIEKYNKIKMHLNKSGKERSVDEGAISNEIEARKKKEKKDNILTKIIPALVTPFIMSTTFLPMMLFFMKMTLLKSMILGKFAILFGLINLIHNLTKEKGGLYSHNINLHHQDHDLYKAHYGYTGDEEYGAYVNKK